MFSVNYHLKEHLNSFSDDGRSQIINYNSLQFIVNDIEKNKKLFSKEYIENKACYYRNQKSIFNFVEILKKNNCEKILLFKGIILANQLYDEPVNRMVADIDVLIIDEDIKRVYNILLENGYLLKNANGTENKHHWVMLKEGVVFELHISLFHPIIGLNEKYFFNHLKSVSFCNTNALSLNDTATFLHLLYHLYMDTWLIGNNLYSIYSNKIIKKANRFLYRAYEIALFSEKYFDDIIWDDVIKDISKQNLRIIFKKMVLDIIQIFPDAFPKSFVDTVCKIKYIDDERDQLYKYLIDSEIKKCDKDIDYILINYINDNWEARREKNIYRKVSETILLIKESLDETKQDLNCLIDTEKTTEGLKIVFKVSSDDFCISEIDNYDTQASDGVHLLLCGTEQYSYNSIFFFPKQIGGEIRVVVCDVLNNRNQILTDDLIKAEFSKTENDYTITATLSNEFLKENNLNSYLYMGLVISDCSSETHRRKNQLILSEDDSQWYNPTYFAKIDLL